MWFQASWSGNDKYSASPVEDIATLGIVASGTKSDDPVWSGAPYANNPVVGGAEPLAVGAITNTGTGSLEYASKTPQVCSVAADGSLSGLIGGVDACIVSARFAGNSSTAPSAWVDSPAITVEKATHPALVDDSSYYGVRAAVAEEASLALTIAPMGFGAATYSVKLGSESFCSVDETTGEVTGISPGDCIIQVAFAGDEAYNALDVTDLQTIRVHEKNYKFRWNPYMPSVVYRIGDIFQVGEVDVGGTGASVEYAVVNAGRTQCTFEKSTGNARLRLSAVNYGICRIRAEVTLGGKVVWTAERNVQIRPGAFQVRVDGFSGGDTLVVGSGFKTPGAYRNLRPRGPDVDVYWELVRGERDCTLVNPKNGSVLARAVPIEDPADPPQVFPATGGEGRGLRHL